MLSFLKIVQKSSHDYTPLVFFGGMIIFILIFVVVIMREEREDEEQFELRFKSDNFRLLNVMMKETIKYYKINRFKNTVIFLIAIIACFMGLYITAFHQTLLDYIFGTVTEFIAATFFWIYKQCQKEEKYYSDKLFYLKRIFIVISLVDKEDKKDKNSNYDKIINILLNKE